LTYSGRCIDIFWPVTEALRLIGIPGQCVDVLEQRIDVLEQRIDVLEWAHNGDVQRGTMKSPKILKPSSQHRIDPASDVVNFEVCPPIESLFSDRIAYLARRPLCR
jgi:hypothetical protein